MAENQNLDKRLAWCRLAVWMTALLVTWTFFRTEYPSAWGIAAFGAGFSFFWPLVRRTQAQNAPVALPGPSQQEAGLEETVVPAATDTAFARGIDVGMDLIFTTTLVNMSGGFNSPFSPLYFVTVVEAYVLLGATATVYTALAAALLSLVHFRVGEVPRNAAVLYGMAMGTLVMTAILFGLRQSGSLSGSNDRGLPGRGKRSTLMKQRTVEMVEQQLEEQTAALRQLRENYREVAQLHRDQRTQLERLRTAEELFEASSLTLPDSDTTEAYGKLLHILMAALEAAGAVLWLHERPGDRLIVQAVEGRVAPLVRAEPIPHLPDMSPADLRAVCEERLLAAAPVVRRAAAPSQSEVVPEEEGNREDAASAEAGLVGAAKPVMVVLLREVPAESGAIGAILGAVGVCDPRGVARFSAADADRFQALAAPCVAALTNIQQRRVLQRRVREISLLYDLSRLVQSATDMNQIYSAVVNQVQQVIPCQNCTLFLLDKTHNRLESKATRGRVVNLLDHVAFEKGHGISGWVASRGKPLIITDLTQEQNLLNVEMIPPRIRSFVAMPLRVQDNIVGVLNVSHSQSNAFSQEDIQLLTILAGQAAITIERTEVFHTLETLAITDGLTQVYNHRYFQMRLEEELRRGRRYSQPVSVMFVDADEFKRINDQYGHITGDEVLRELAALLRRTVRETEIVARYGGEEFALILPQTGDAQAQIAAERVRANVAGHAFMSSDGQPIRLTISIGIATSPLHAKNSAELIAQADSALYTAKQQGRNTVRMATAPVERLPASGPT